LVRRSASSTGGSVFEGRFDFVISGIACLRAEIGGQAFGSLLSLLSFASGHFQVRHLNSIALLQGSFAILQGQTWQSIITMLVPEAQRERANGIQEIGFPLASVIAPCLAGLVYGAVRNPLLLGIGLFLTKLNFA